MLAGFWIFWTIDALISGVVLFFFFAGLADGTVSSFNIGIWAVLLAACAVEVGGSLWLKSIARPGLGILLLLVLAAPALFYVLILLTAVLTGARWN